MTHGSNHSMPSLQKTSENNVIWEMSFHWKEIDELISSLCKFLELILSQKLKPSYTLPWYAHLKNQIFQIFWWSWSWKRSIKTNVDNAEQCWFTVLALHFRNNILLPRKGVFQPSFRSIGSDSNGSDFETSFWHLEFIHYYGKSGWSLEELKISQLIN